MAEVQKQYGTVQKHAFIYSTYTPARVKNSREKSEPSFSGPITEVIFKPSLTLPLPAQHPQNQVQHKEGSNDDQGDKIDPGPPVTHCIIHLGDGSVDKNSPRA